MAGHIRLLGDSVSVSGRRGDHGHGLHAVLARVIVGIVIVRRVALRFEFC